MSKIAAIDIGSNSVRLLICERTGSTLFSKKKQKKTTRLGADVSDKGFLNEDRIKNTLKALKEFKNICAEEEVEEIIVYATSAVRDAANKEKFLNLVKENTDFKVMVITGEEEAELGYLGLSCAGENSKYKNQVLIDVGGSSTEITLIENSKIVCSESFRIGAVRYLYDFFSDVDELEGMRYARADMEEKMESMFDLLISKSPIQAILIGGTATTIAMCIQGMDKYISENIDGYPLTLSEIKNLLEDIFMTEPDKRKNITGIESQRSEIILQGIIIIEFILKSIGAKDILISDGDSLEGAIFKYGKSGI